MNRITPHLKPDSATPAKAAEFRKEHPATAAYLDGMLPQNQSRLRKALLAHGYPDSVVVTLVPPTRARPRDAPEGPWSLLTAPVRDSIAEALKVGALSTSPTAWTPAKAHIAADVITAHYDNIASQTLGLSSLRSALRAVFAPKDAPQEVIAATLRPDITIARNKKAEEAREARAGAGISLPGPYRTIEALVGRVRDYIASCDDPTAQTAADFLVAFSARPGEAQTLELGARGSVTGMLKKRGNNDTMPLVSALGRGMAEQFITRWKAEPITARAKAMRDLPALVREWGLQQRDLRAVGANLAVRAAALSGGAINAVQARDVERAALRHAAPARRAAADHYARVNDPSVTLSALIAEIGLDDVIEALTRLRDGGR